MPILAPVIVDPFAGVNFTTNVEVQTFRGTSDTGTIQVFVNGSAFGVTFTILTGEWSYETAPLTDGPNTFKVKGWDGISFSPEITQIIEYAPSETILATIAPPTAISFRAFKDAIDILVEQSLSTSPAFIPVGYNFYYSQTGGTGFIKLNTLPIRTPSEVIKNILDRTEEVIPDQTMISYEQLGGTFVKRATLVTEVYQEIGRFIYRHDTTSSIQLNPTIPAYYFITALYYDEDLNIEIESVPSEELVAQAISIDTTIRSLPRRTRTDVASDYINYVFETDPTIDLSPGSIVREIYIEPFANEVEKLLFLIDFYSRAQSFITLVQVDDADGDGISDPVASSEYKQRLKIAMGFVSDDEVQRVIDEAFSKLSGNLNIPRANSDLSLIHI